MMMLKTLVKTTRTTTRIYVSAHRNQEGSFLFLGIAWLKTLTASTNKNIRHKVLVKVRLFSSDIIRCSYSQTKSIKRF